MLEKLNPFRRVRALGVDIGTYSLKWAVVDQARRQVIRSGCHPFSPAVPDFDRLLEELKTGLTEVSADTPLHSVVGGRATAYGYLEFSALSEDELAVACQAEAQQWIPFAPEEMRFSYSQVPALSEDSGQGVFYAAALDREVTRLRGLLSRALREPDRLEVPPLPLAREYAWREPDELGFVALVSVGYSSTLLVVVRQGYPYYAREFTPGTRHFIQLLAGEEAFRQADFSGPRLANPLVRLANGVSRSLAAFAPARNCRLVLTGGGASQSLADCLAKRLERPVRFDDAGLFRTAVGLAV
ncbi:MAG: pilus assembly protein PilM [Candidatus Eremiobacteraeota bacterium]|nr:pilus assembly protein PilM [Candidatus Eremiobacteraeota bacterium]